MAGDGDGKKSAELSEADIRTIVDDTRTKVREEMVGQFAKWIIGGGVLLLVLASAGAWGILRPILINEIGGIPKDAIVAFDRPDGCNTLGDRWTSFENGASRFIVGASDTHASEVPNQDEKGKPLTSRPFRKDGGEEIVVVGPVGVKSHQHVLGVVSFSQFYPGGGISAGDIRSAGNIVMLPGGSAPSANQKLLTQEFGELENENLNNMPPYIALYFCRKG